VSFLRRSWAEIDINAIIDNFNSIKDRCSNSAIMCVVKADAYGHGANYLSKVYDNLGADYYAVAALSEALNLRRFGTKTPILILGYTLPEYYEYVVNNNITQTIFSYEDALLLSQCAVGLKKTAKVHIKIDTGMTRLGFDLNDNTISQIIKISKLKGIEIEGVFSHFAVSDEADPDNYTKLQFDKLVGFTDQLKSNGVNIRYRHISNSGGVFASSKYQLDMVRPGIALYGLYDSVNYDNSLKPALSLKTIIAQIRKVPKKTTVSYGRTYCCDTNKTLATIPIGYADGYNRQLSNKGRVIVNGKFAPVVGRVCMDQTIIDVTGIGCKQGDTVILIGSDGTNNISASELALLSNTINYEIVCAISDRIPRLYIKDGAIEHILDKL
jgi:alanine racemase